MNKLFDWGLIENNTWFRKRVEEEIFKEDVYQKFFKVEKGDIVFDVGASVGPFVYHIKNKKPKKVYCFEPHPSLFRTLVKNVEDNNVECINKAILGKDGHAATTGLFNPVSNDMCDKENKRLVPSVTFKTFIKDANIDRIDFLKTDCEGAEYDIFTDDNLSWIKSNVKKISGEWHLIGKEQKDKFRHFRDTYLKEFKNHQVYSLDNVDIKHSLWSDWFIEYYNLINLYIKV